MACAGCGLAMGAAPAPAQPQISKAQAEAELAKMKRSLKGWLKYRKLNDEVAAGKVKAEVPQAMAAANLRRNRDWAGEQKLAEDLYMLLSEVYDARLLPQANVQADPNAAVKLATIALTGKLPGKVPTPIEQGILPLIVLSVAGVVLFSMTSWIRNNAEVQKEKERLECIKSGACTDYGFWLKWGAIGIVGVLVFVNRDKILSALKVGGKKGAAAYRRRRKRR
jgi:hypothetical protein